MKTKEEILDLTKMWYLNVYTPNYKVIDAYKIPEFTPAHWFILERIRAIMMNCTDMYKTVNNNYYEDNGLQYYWISSTLLLSHTMRFGVKSKQTISRIIADWRAVEPAILVTSIEGHGRGSKIFYAFTEFATKKLFNTGNVDVSGINDQQPEDEDEDVSDTTSVSSPSVPAEIQEDPPESFPDWFDKQWEVLTQSGMFKKCTKMKGDTPIKYALDFAKAVQQLTEGTLYEGVGKPIKDKSLAIPEGLTIKGVILSILDMGGKFDTPMEAVITSVWTREGKKSVCAQCYSPLLRFLNRQPSSAKRPTENAPVKKGVRSNLTYTKDDYIHKKHIKYLWDMEVDQVDHKGETYKGILFGSLPDTWLNTHKYVKKFDTRIDNFFVDICEAYEDTGVKRPPMYKIMDTLEDMARFSCKDNGKKWEEELWGMVASMQVYQDNKLWNWFTEQFERRYGESICKMHQGNKQRAAALAADAEFRELEMTAKALLYGEDD